MATPYSTIYNSFLDQMSDLDFLSFTSNTRETLMLGYMNRACTQFEGICRLDLTDRNDTTKQFNATLTNEDIDIIVCGMLVEWMKPKYLYNVNMKNVLNTKDYNQYSPANLLKELRETYNNLLRTFESKINRYSFMNGNIENLTPQEYI